MSTESMSPSEAEAADVAELRRLFFSERRGAIEAGKFALADVRRLRTDDAWLLQFLRRCDFDLDVTLPILAETLKWRHDFGLHSLSVVQLRPVLERQAMYIRGRDKDQVPLLWFNVRHQKKDEEDVRKLIVLWLEKHNREFSGEPIVIVFDMSSTGLQNMDLDLIKFLLHCLKFHFPGLLAYLLVYEIPWILNAAWKLVKSWLDPVAQKKIVFVNKTSIKDYIPLTNLPLHIGGTDDYRFAMEHISSAPLADGESQFDEELLEPAALGNFSPRARKTVKFADGQSGEDAGEEEKGRRLSAAVEEPTTTRNGPLLLNGGQRAVVVPNEPPPSPPAPVVPSLLAAVGVVETGSPPPASPSTPPRSSLKVGQSLSQRLKEMSEWRLREEGLFHAGPLLSISPRDTLLLQSVSGEQDRVDAIVLRNASPDAVVAFKVKITSPERFRVRPSLGVVKADSHTIVKVYLQPGHEQTVHKDKFLVQSMSVDREPESPEQLGELWKANGPDAIIEHRLRVKLDGEAPPPETSPVASPRRSPKSAAVGGKVLGAAEESVAELRAEISDRDRILKILLVLLLAFIVLLFLHQRLVLSDIQGHSPLSPSHPKPTNTPAQLNEAKTQGSCRKDL